MTTSTTPIPALAPRGPGHQFVLYGDACSGVPGAPHEGTFAGVNAVVRRLAPAPDFIIFPGDEVVGLTTDRSALLAQWRHWLEVEMAWLDRTAVPLFHTTSNHTTYGEMSERVFTEAFEHLPRNGPKDQRGLSYHVRRDDLLMVFVNTCWSGLGGEGHVETDWLQATLEEHHDAKFKLVIGHHPVFPVNGFSGPGQREIHTEHAAGFWRILVTHGVTAYLCSHILAFDAQVHDGVLQILSAGAGTAHRMPEKSEYLHCVQLALDAEGVRYQVIDDVGVVREGLSWPPRLPPSDAWSPLPTGRTSAPARPQNGPALIAWRLTSRTSSDNTGSPQTLLCTHFDDAALETVWIGLTGQSQRLTVMLSPEPGRSPHSWYGPEIGADVEFDLQLAIHVGMGPGGILWRRDDAAMWTSLSSASSWGAERLVWPDLWTIGNGKSGPGDRPFRGRNLTISTALERATM